MPSSTRSAPCSPMCACPMTWRAPRPRCAPPAFPRCSRCGCCKDTDGMLSRLQQGAVIDGFRLEEELPLAATAAFWRVSQEGSDTPLVMKIPRLEAGANPIKTVGAACAALRCLRQPGESVYRHGADRGPVAQDAPARVAAAGR